MAGFIQNILWNSVSGFVEAGTRTAGGYAGDALIKAGDMVENGGRSVGNNIERRASNYATAISGQGYQPSAKALPSTARKPAIKRSNSSPAVTHTKAVAPTSKTPLGANKYPSGKQAAGATGAKSAVGGAKSTAGSTMGGAGKGPGGAVGGAQKAVNSTASTAKSAPRSLPKAYPNNAPKTAVKPGQTKPFKAEQKDEKKSSPYPGTNTLPGQGGKTPVQAKKYQPMGRMAAPADRGKAQHISV